MKTHQKLVWEDLDTAYLQQLATIAQQEDLCGLGQSEPSHYFGDLTTAAMPQFSQAKVDFVTRQPATLAGLRLLPLILRTYGPKGPAVWSFHKKDGDAVQAKTVIASLGGPAVTILAAERVMLNFLQHMCGVATMTAKYVALMGDSKSRLLDTRKTLPGYRMLDKYAFACGGGWNHRLGLNHWPMFKDNHLAVLGVSGLGEAISRFREQFPNMPVEVEVDFLDQLPEVLRAGADIVLLDNFSIPMMREAMDITQNQALLEASGGITAKTLPAIAALNLPFISTGAPIHQSVWIDIGLDWSA